jgi:serine/threonine protein kinase
MAEAKMPSYPGLGRWTLLETMGKGGFSNVYRAKDSTSEHGEVAIKVLRKYEMNDQQVRRFYAALVTFTIVNN